jgi:very-short-patch-repair endonuclease
MKANPVTRARAKKLRRALTPAETILWSRLGANQLAGWHFRKQHPIGRFIADFACARARLVVEADGWTHSSAEAALGDRVRTQFMEKQGWSVIRFSNQRVFKDTVAVMDAILTELGGHRHDARHIYRRPPQPVAKR